MVNPQELCYKLTRVDPVYYTQRTCNVLVEKLNRIAFLKKEKNAVLLAHNYQRPEIFEVADYVGDSLGLSLQAGEVTEAEAIIFCGVHFMAETAKIVSPSKKVVLPNLNAGCSLADTADADEVEDRILEQKLKYPDLATVCYVNTTAAVKALCDVCCTSANAVEIVRGLESKNILFIPDQNLACHVAKEVPEKNIIAWEGYCYVHHEVQPNQIMKIKYSHPNLKVMVHPECRDDVVELADAVMSTSGMVDYAKTCASDEFLAVTECGLSDLLNIAVPDKKFYRACKICMYMKMITLDNIIESLETLHPEIFIPESTRIAAESSIRMMYELTAPDKMPMALA